MCFDLTNGNDYYEIIQQVAQDPYFQEEDLGDPRGLDWDIDFLKVIITTIIRDHSQKLKDILPEYQDIRIVGSYIYNATAYALVNNKEQLSPEELLNTFKNWDYIPFFIRLQTLDTLYQENDLSEVPHPIRHTKNKNSKPKQKIILFPTDHHN